VVILDFSELEDLEERIADLPRPVDNVKIDGRKLTYIFFKEKDLEIPRISITGYDPKTATLHIDISYLPPCVSSIPRMGNKHLPEGIDTVKFHPVNYE